MVNAFVHQLFDFSRLIGLRDRLRCPSCDAVGTYKPHGGWLDTEDVRGARRWLCKWCGFYSGPETGVYEAHLGEKCWKIGGGSTPQGVLENHMRTNPWNG